MRFFRSIRHLPFATTLAMRVMLASAFASAVVLGASMACLAQEAQEEEAPLPPPLDPPKGLTRMAKDQDVWIDKERRTVVVDGRISLREGQLEMFACPKGTKEHESVIVLNSRSRFIHAGLLAIGAKPGTPVQFAPEYQGATGPIVDVFVVWKDDAGKEQKIKAQELIRNVKTKKPMAHDWVFAGSGFWKDDETGQEYYQADNGEAICVSNFSTAMLDLPIESSQTNADLLFVANTEKIPKLGTPVRLILAPRFEKTAAGKATDGKGEQR